MFIYVNIKGEILKRKQTKNYPSTTSYQNNPNKKQFKKIIDLVENLIDKHEKILVCRGDLLAHNLPDHKDIQALIRKIKNHYGSDYYACAWTCEDSSEHGKQGKHYHLALFLNGHKFKSDYTHMEEILRWWTKRTGLKGSVSRFNKSKGDKNSVGLLRRSDTEKFEDVIYGLSYLCKTSQKKNSTDRLFSISHYKS